MLGILNPMSVVPGQYHRMSINKAASIPEVSDSAFLYATVRVEAPLAEENTATDRKLLKPPSLSINQETENTKAPASFDTEASRFTR